MSGTERVNTTSNGSGRVDDIKGHPRGERFGAELYGGRLRAFASRSREAGDSVLVNSEKFQRGFRGETKLVKPELRQQPAQLHELKMQEKRTDPLAALLVLYLWHKDKLHIPAG